MSRQFEMLALTGIAAAFQWRAAWQFSNRLRGESTRVPEKARPPSAVLVPCKGAGPELALNVRALLAQGDSTTRFMFVVPSREDPAWGVISREIGQEGRATLLVAPSGPPQRCSGKIADLLFALTLVDEEVLVFADADLKVPEHWLERLLDGLEGGCASTACMLYSAVEPGIWSFLRMAWMAAGMPYLAERGVVAGHSFAIRRQDFERLEIRSLWQRSLMEDLALSALLRSRHLKVTHVVMGMPVSTEPCRRSDFFSLFTKWLTCIRIYDPWLWGQAFGACLLHILVFIISFGPPRPLFFPPALLLLCDGLYVARILFLLRARMPERFDSVHSVWRPLEIWAILIAPLLWASYVVQVLLSLRPARLRWQGRVYRLRGPQDVEVVG